MNCSRARLMTLEVSNLAANRVVLHLHFTAVCVVVVCLFLTATSSFPEWRSIFSPNGFGLAWNVNKQHKATIRRHNSVCGIMRAVRHCVSYSGKIRVCLSPPFVTLPAQCVPLISDLLQHSCSHKALLKYSPSLHGVLRNPLFKAIEHNNDRGAN